MMKSSRIYIVALAALFGCGGLSDIRNERLKKVSSIESDPQAVEIVNRSIKAYGGLEKWRSSKKTTVTSQDYWPGIIGGVYNPWPKSPQKLSHEFWNGTFDSELTHLDGAKRGQVWKRANGESFMVVQGKTHEVKGFNVSFFPPTFQYLVELPYRMSEIPILKYYGDSTLNNVSYDLIFGTWGSMEPNIEVDQYILWINQSTRLVDYFQYSVRAWSSSAVGSVNYADFRDIDGVLIPFHQKITPKPGADFVLHELKLESVQLTYR